MRPPKCAVCGREARRSPDLEFELVEFADLEPLPEGWSGHPAGLEWFCSEHVGAARARAHLPVAEALRELREEAG